MDISRGDLLVSKVFQQGLVKFHPNLDVSKMTGENPLKKKKLSILDFLSLLIIILFAMHFTKK